MALVVRLCDGRSDQQNRLPGSLQKSKAWEAVEPLDWRVVPNKIIDIASLVASGMGGTRCVMTGVLGVR